MPRRPRENQEGAVYHVFARGNGKQLVFLGPADRRLYLGLLRQVVASHGWLCLSYCLMDNHVHLLIETPMANLSRGMQQLHGSYAQAFNRRHDRVGHVFQGRYGAERIRSDRQLCATAVYIARNPVEAGLCDRPDQWPWGSSCWLQGDPGVGWVAKERLLSFFGTDIDSARRRFAEQSDQPSVNNL